MITGEVQVSHFQQLREKRLGPLLLCPSDKLNELPHCKQCFVSDTGYLLTTRALLQARLANASQFVQASLKVPETIYCCMENFHALPAYRVLLLGACNLKLMGAPDLMFCGHAQRNMSNSESILCSAKWFVRA